MKFTSGIWLATLLHYFTVIVTVKSIELNERHHKSHRIVQWTDKFGREKSSVTGPKAQRNNEETPSPSPSTKSWKFRPIFSQDKHKGKNEVTLDGNNSVASLLVHPPLSSEKSTVVYDTIPGHEFCDGKIPESRICNPQDLISIKEGSFQCSSVKNPR